MQFPSHEHHCYSRSHSGFNEKSVKTKHGMTHLPTAVLNECETVAAQYLKVSQPGSPVHLAVFTGSHRSGSNPKSRGNFSHDMPMASSEQ